jgi:hypothetical protein
VNCRSGGGSGESMKTLNGKQGKSVAALLDCSEDRVKLLRAGFSGKEIEALYSILNSFEIVSVNWQTAEGV